MKAPSFVVQMEFCSESNGSLMAHWIYPATQGVGLVAFFEGFLSNFLARSNAAQSQVEASGFKCSGRNIRIAAVGESGIVNIEVQAHRSMTDAEAEATAQSILNAITNERVLAIFRDYCNAGT